MSYVLSSHQRVFSSRATAPSRPICAIAGEQIAAIGSDLHGDQIIDAPGCYVLPGAVDNHVHLQMALGGLVSTRQLPHRHRRRSLRRHDHRDRLCRARGGAAAAACPDQRRAEADGQVAVDYGLHMTIPTWHAADTERLVEVPEVVAAGCPTFKMYQAYPGVMLDDPSLLRALTAVADAGGRTVLHSETGPVLDILRADALAEGHVEPIWHAYTRPAPLEATAVHRAAELADLGGLPALHLPRRLRWKASEAIAAAQARGLDVWGETCPQYLLLNAEEHLGGPTARAISVRRPCASLDDQDAPVAGAWPTTRCRSSAPTTARGRWPKRHAPTSPRFRAACPASKRAWRLSITLASTRAS